jgi:hypothetical protein
VFDLFSDDMRRDPYPVYDRMREDSPVFHLAQFDLWMIFDEVGSLNDPAIAASCPSRRSWT